LGFRCPFLDTPAFAVEGHEFTLPQIRHRVLPTRMGMVRFSRAGHHLHVRILTRNPKRNGAEAKC